SSPGKGQGATFRVQLATVPEPAANPPAQEPSSDLPLRPALKVLLVEDHPDTLNMMARLLRHLKFSVSRARSVGSALEAAAAEDFDLLLCDIALPDGSGLDLMRALRTRESIKGIALSGFGMDEDVRRSHEAGFIAHLTKPVDLTKLEAVLRTL